LEVVKPYTGPLPGLSIDRQEIYELDCVLNGQQEL
jgi:hypothetical protein